MIYVGNILEFRYFGCTLSTFRTVGSGIYSTNILVDVEIFHNSRILGVATITPLSADSRTNIIRF